MREMCQGAGSIGPQLLQTDDHFVAKRDGAGWRGDVQRKGEIVETIACTTRLELGRVRDRLVDGGLVGLIEEGA